MEENTLIKTIIDNVREEMNAAADQVIEKKVEEFRKELIMNKNEAIAQFLNSLELSTSESMETDCINITLTLQNKYKRRSKIYY